MSLRYLKFSVTKRFHLLLIYLWSIHVQEQIMFWLVPTKYALTNFRQAKTDGKKVRTRKTESMVTKLEMKYLFQGSWKTFHWNHHDFTFLKFLKGCRFLVEKIRKTHKRCLASCLVKSNWIDLVLKNPWKSLCLERRSWDDSAAAQPRGLREPRHFVLAVQIMRLSPRQYTSPNEGDAEAAV